MTSKADRTKAHILEQVAPIFNRNGYIGTSMSAITSAIGLSKGAVYGNFESKEDLALESFNYNVRRVIWPLADRINAQNNATDKLKAITIYYRHYYDVVKSMGGCPLLNIGIDAYNQNPLLSNRVKVIIQKLVNQIAEIITEGINNGEFRSSLNPQVIARRIYAMIEGSLFSSSLMGSDTFLIEMMEHIDSIIEKELLI